MGWSSTLISNKPITEEILQDVIDKLPPTLGCKQFPGKQNWGWPCYADVSIPSGNQVTVSGSYSMSSENSEMFVKLITKGLEERGYENIVATPIR